MDRWKSRGGKSQKREEKRREERRSEKRKCQKKEYAGARKGRTVAIHCVFPIICGSRGSKSRLAKAAGAEPSGQVRDEKLHAVVARSTFASEKAKSTSRSEHFWKLRSWDVEKVRTVVAPSTFRSQNVQSTPRSETLLEVEMSKKCTLLWREAHFGVKSVKNWRVRSTFGSWHVENMHATVARSTFPSQNVQSTSASEHFWKLRCRQSARRCGAKHVSKSKGLKLKTDGLGALLEVEMLKKCTPLWREAHFQVKLLKAPHVRTTFEGSDVVLCGRRKGFRTWATTHYRKNSFATFYLFARLHLLSSHSFSSSFCWLFLFSDAARPVHRIGSLTSKSPSVLYNVNPGLINL